MWFILSLISIFFWGSADLFSKLGSASDDKYSHWKIVTAVGAVMGIHATAEILCGADFHPADFLRYSPAIICYVSSMTVGYFGLRYIMLSLFSPLCNSSGAVACILCLVFLRQLPDLFSWVGIILICAGVIALAVTEQKASRREMTSVMTNKKYSTGFLALIFPLIYCLLDGLGTFADALILDKGIVEEGSANIAYEYTFFFMAALSAVYVYAIKKQKIAWRRDLPKLACGLCETGGQLSYIYAIGSNPTAVAPLVSAYCIFSVVLSRIFLKERLSKKHYIIILTVLAGIVFLGFSE